jgi:pimeloyl-ACP methyl ester carboxylesterase
VSPFGSLILRLLRSTALAVVITLALLSSCQSRFIYLPRPYPPDQSSDFLQHGGTRLDFQTSAGKQTAWLLLPATNQPPENVWLVTAGNGSLALDLTFLPQISGLTKDAFVFIDYPGYGACEGKPHPKTITESLQILRPLVAERCRLSLSELSERGIVWGHSLGAAVALLAAQEFGIRRAFLLSPFTSTMEMTQVALGIPLGFLVTHRFDNKAQLQHLVERQGRAFIIHGSDDEVIPVRMGSQLAQAAGPSVTFHEITGGRHNQILSTASREISAAMASLRSHPPQ